MKNGLLLAAGAVLGTASAGVHKMKLQKVPLSEQLVGAIEAVYLPDEDHTAHICAH